MKRSLPTPKGLGSTAGLSWLQKTKRVALFLIFFLSPTQLGLHFWPDSALIYGVRIDYLSPTLYFLDILIILYLLLSVFTSQQPRGGIKIHGIWYLALILLANLVFSVNPVSTLSWSLHLLLYISFLSSFSLVLNHKLLSISLTLASLFQLVLSIAQVWLGHSIQGPLYYLGERMVSVGQPGVALATFMNEVVLRAYGTFGHPNVLAGWLVITSLIMFKLSKNTLLKHGALIITIFGVMLTQSRSALLALFGILIPFYVMTNLRQRLIYFASILTLLCGILFINSTTLSRSLDLSYSERLSLQLISIKTIVNYPVFGTGTQASITAQSTQEQSRLLRHAALQPDHNSFTLFLSWFGIGGLLMLFFVSRLYGFTALLIRLIPLLPLLLLDHYLLTSPQGLLVLLLYLRVTMNHKL